MGRKAIAIEPYMDKLEQAIMLGATYEIAAMYAGISERTFQRWRVQAEKAPLDSALGILRERLRHAEGKAAISWLAKIEKAALEGSYQAAIWKLERRFPEQYGREPVRKVALTTPDGEQAWEPTLGLAILLEAARQALPPSNGHNPLLVPESPA